MKVKFIILALVFMSIDFNAQSNKHTFDFWIGSWDAYWKGDTAQGTNTITKTLKDLVVEENFRFNDGSFNGRSWSMFDTIKKVWKQTWVDDSGAYLTFIGGKEGDKVILQLAEKKLKNGKSINMRMIFYNIKQDSFDWNWQSSADDKNWKSNWLIHYKRKP
ncbi:MAG: tetratricopeptide repeat protein [Bacteroidetes bacterium]|jgi:hypothetical protein|nr:tetratricopeptide repeat protein [Bacteroidota bacterium]